MNRSDILTLQSMSTYPSISILAPTHRTAPENEQDPILLKNLIREAEQRLSQEFERREYESCIDRLWRMANRIDHRYNLDGLALYVNQYYERTFKLPFSPKARAVVDETFATRELVYAMNRNSRYWVLVLSEKPTRLYEGLGQTLIEVEEHGFSRYFTGPGGDEPLPAGTGVEPSAHLKERHRHFFREADKAFSKIANKDNLPLVVVGIERYHGYFDEVSKNKNRVVARVHGNYDDTPVHKLAEAVWPKVEEYFNRRRREVRQEIEDAFKARRFAAGVEEVWQLAHQGRGHLLIVEEGFEYPALPSEDGWTIQPAEDTTSPSIIDDAVDEIVEAVIAKGGHVIFLPDGELSDYGRIGLILRY